MNKRHYEHTLPNIRGSLSNTYNSFILASTSDIDIEEFPLSRITRRTTRFATAYEWYFINSTHQIEKILSLPPYSI